jgi:hypothetical protein
MMQVWEVPTEDTFRLVAAGEGHVLTLLPDRYALSSHANASQEQCAWQTLRLYPPVSPEVHPSGHSNADVQALSWVSLNAMSHDTFPAYC